MDCNRYNVLVLTPATLRPHLYMETLKSFSTNCFHRRPINGDVINYKLALNIDTVGEAKYHCDNITKLAENCFDEDNIWYVNENYGECSLASAFYRLWQFASISPVDYVFYLEDDWLLLEEVDMSVLIKIMSNNPNLATLRLNRFKSDVAFAKQWRHKFNWTGEYFKCPCNDKDHIGWCGHPGLVRMGFIRDTFPLLLPYLCPERQMKGLYGDTPMRKIIRKWDYGVYSVPGGPPLIQDIGRSWRSRREIVKRSDTTWQPKINPPIGE